MRDGRRFCAPPKPYRPPDTPAGKVNLTDPDSRNLKTPRGYMQGYHAQAVCTERQIVIAAEIQHRLARLRAPRADGHGGPVGARAGRVGERPGVVVADAGYWHQAQMDNVINRGIPVLVPPDAGKRKGARPGWDGGAYAFMRRVLATELAKQLYRKRQVTIEPVFAHTKFNRRIDRCLRRGRSACRSEWRLITTTHNLVKLHRHQIAAATT